MPHLTDETTESWRSEVGLTEGQGRRGLSASLPQMVFLTFAYCEVLPAWVRSFREKRSGLKERGGSTVVLRPQQVWWKIL